MSAVRILMLVPDLKNKGPIIVMKTIAFSLKEEFEFYICSLRKSNSEDLQEYLSRGIPVSELGMLSFPSVETVSKLKKIIIKNEIDILHTHCFWPTIVGSFVKIRKLVTIHNNPFEDYIFEYGKIAGNCMAYVQQAALKRYEVICISCYVKEQILKHKFVQQASVVYNGISSRIELKRERTLTSEINLINISVLNKRKDVKRTVDILKKIYEKTPGYHLHIVGDGSEREKIEHLIKKNNLEEQVTLWGQLPFKETQELLSQSDILLFTSKSEGFGLVVIEAMRQGVVPVVNAIPVMSEIVVPESGYICRTDEDFVERLLELSDIEVLGKMKENAYHHFCRRFTTRELSEGYKNIYRDFQRGTD